jgi:hypothetical protein
MREVFIVSSDNKMKAEDLLKKDDLVSRGSIILKVASSLDIKEDGYFIILDASDEALKKAEELIKNIAKKYSKKDVVLERFDEQEDTAIEGLGAILG